MTELGMAKLQKNGYLSKTDVVSYNNENDWH